MTAMRMDWGYPLVCLTLLILADGQVQASNVVKCACGAGRELELGMVSYGHQSDRQRIVEIEADTGGACKAVSVEQAEIFPRGTPAAFYLERTSRRIKTFCGSMRNFVVRERSYEFVFDGRHARSISELRRVIASPPARIAADNKNLWQEVIEQPVSGGLRLRGTANQHDATQEFNRGSWILTGKKIRAHTIGILQEPGGNSVLPLKRRAVAAGQVGQIEAVRGQFALVRFYKGSLVESFGRSIASWWWRAGGPYGRSEDGLYTQERAEVLEVSLADIVEVNDYLDKAGLSKTADPKGGR